MVFERMALKSSFWAAMGLALAGVASGQDIDAGSSAGSNTASTQDVANSSGIGDEPDAIGANADANSDTSRREANSGFPSNSTREGTDFNTDGTRTNAQINADGTRSGLQRDGNNAALGAANNRDVNGRSTLDGNGRPMLDASGRPMLDSNSAVNANGSYNRDNSYGNQSRSSVAPYSVRRPIYEGSESISVNGQAHGVTNYGQPTNGGYSHSGSSGYQNGNIQSYDCYDPCRQQQVRRVRHGRWCR